MSTNSKRIVLPATLFLTLFALAAGAAAQSTVITIKVAADSSRVTIDGSCSASTSFSFRDTYAGLMGLGERIGKLGLFDKDGASVAFHKLAPGQFESSSPSIRFTYEVNLTPPAFPNDAAKVSWLTNEQGLLMPRDLLPILICTSGILQSRLGGSTIRRVYVTSPSCQ